MSFDYKFNAPLSLYALPVLYGIASYPQMAKVHMPIR